MFSEPVVLSLYAFFLIFLRRLSGFTLLMAFPQAGREGISTSQESRSCQVKEVSPEHLSICLQLRDKPALDLTTDLMMNSLLTLSVINLS